MANNDDKLFDDFRSIFAALTTTPINGTSNVANSDLITPIKSNNTPIALSEVIHNIFDKYAMETVIVDKNNQTKSNQLDYEGFEKGFYSIKNPKVRISKDDLKEIFIAISDSGDINQNITIAIDDITNFCHKTFSKARLLSLKLKSLVSKEYQNNIVEYKKLFDKMKDKTENYIKPEIFYDFIEEKLNMNISDNDLIGIYKLFDCDNDGKLTYFDFSCFLCGSKMDIYKVLQVQYPQMIVDVKISSNAVQFDELFRLGYEQIVPTKEMLTNVSITNANQLGTFGKAQSIWIWRKRNGTMLGRLRPIVDIRVESTNISTELILSGYLCINESINGQYIWIKRAITNDEEYDGILDLYVSLGLMKNPGDKLWLSPASVGWNRVDGNFSKGLFSSYDAFLWINPLRNRSMESYYSTPLRSIVTLSEESKFIRLLTLFRMIIRNYIPLNRMQIYDDGAPEMYSSAVNFDIASLFHKYDKSKQGNLTKGQFNNLLDDVGMKIDRNDAARLFRFFDLNADGTMGREEYLHVIGLTDLEIDLLCEHIQFKLYQYINPSFAGLLSTYVSNMQIANIVPTFTGSNSLEQGLICSPIVIADTVKSSAAKLVQNKLTENIVLSEIFSLITSYALSNPATANVAAGGMSDSSKSAAQQGNSGNINGMQLFSFLGCKLDIYVAPDEALHILRCLDKNRDDCVDQNDFCTFMNSFSVRFLFPVTLGPKESTNVTDKDIFHIHPTLVRKYYRIYDLHNNFRQWLQQSSPSFNITGSYNTASAANIDSNGTQKQIITKAIWKDFKKRHEYVLGNKYPGFISPTTFLCWVNTKFHLFFNFIEIKQLFAMIASHSPGIQTLSNYLRLQQQDLENYVLSASCRSLGECLNIISHKDYGVWQSFLENFKLINNEKDCNDYHKLLEEYVDNLQRYQDLPAGMSDGNGNNPNVTASIPVPTTTATVNVLSSSAGSGKQSSGGNQLTSLHQLKQAVESLFFSSKKITLGTNVRLLTVQDWGYLCFPATIEFVDDRPAAVQIANCVYTLLALAIQHFGLTNKYHTPSLPDTEWVDMLCVELLKMLISYQKQLSNNKKEVSLEASYKELFSLFDENRNNQIDNTEFFHMLIKLQLFPELSANASTAGGGQSAGKGEILLKQLIGRIDTKSQGYFTPEDFLKFIKQYQHLVTSSKFNTTTAPGSSLPPEKKVDSEEDILMMCLQNRRLVPSQTLVTMTSSKLCDAWLWYLWKQAYNLHSSDPEYIFQQLQASCQQWEGLETGAVTAQQFYRLLYSHRLFESINGAREVDWEDYNNYLEAVSYFKLDSSASSNIDSPQRYRDSSSGMNNNSSSNSNSKDDPLVDYEAICRYIIRTGRAFNEKLQKCKEKLDKTISGYKKELQMELPKLYTSSSDPSTAGNNPTAVSTSDAVSRCERVLRRIDEDHDGQLTITEFQSFLRKVRYRNMKHWDNPLYVSRLFEDLQSSSETKSSLISVDSLLDFFFSRGGGGGRPMDKLSLSSTNKLTLLNKTTNSTSAGYLNKSVVELNPMKGKVGAPYEDDEEDLIDYVHASLSTSKMNLSSTAKLAIAVTESQVFGKVYRILVEYLGRSNLISATGEADNKIAAIMFDVIRRFCQRQDLNHLGVVLEDRFISFLKKSRIYERLSELEMSFLMDKLRRRNTVNEKPMNEIDYERFIKLLQIQEKEQSVTGGEKPKDKSSDGTKPSQQQPGITAETLKFRLQSLCMEADQQQRSFLALCSLYDPRLTGYITVPNLTQVVSIMSAASDDERNRQPITDIDLKGLGGVTGEKVDYQEFYRQLINLTPRELPGQQQRYQFTPNKSMGYQQTPYDNRKTTANDFTNTISTPFGVALPSLRKPSRVHDSSPPSGFLSMSPALDESGYYNNSAGNSLYEKMIKQLVERMLAAISQLERSQGIPSFPLQAYLENYSSSRLNGSSSPSMISFSQFQSLCGQTLRISVTSAELQALQFLFGNGSDDYERFDYIQFLENYLPQYYQSHRTQQATPPVARQQTNNGNNTQRRGSKFSVGESSSGLIGNDTIQRWRVLLQQGRDPRNYLETYDNNNSGLIDKAKFRLVADKLNLFPSYGTNSVEFNRVCEEYQYLYQANTILYQDFCNDVESLAQQADVVQLDFDPNPLVKSTSSAFPRYSDSNPDFESTLSRPRGALTPPRPSSATSGFLSPVKTSPLPGNRLTNRNNWYDSDDFDSTRLRESTVRGSTAGSLDYITPWRTPYQSGSGRATSPQTQQLPVNRVSPSKVGSRIWGSSISLEKKGLPLNLTSNVNTMSYTVKKAPAAPTTWCCTVCLYVENPIDSPVCLICNSPNYAARGDMFQLKEQCLSCTFLNGEFAEVCEMCGEPLATASMQAKPKFKESSLGLGENLRKRLEDDRFKYSTPLTSSNIPRGK